MPSNLTNLPVDDIRALADERGRYEGWITALESRRGHTPPHVYDRVKQDYDGRLRRVLDRLGEHLPALHDGEALLARRDDELARSVADRQDELAEIELRTVVGEYGADEGARLREEKDGEIRGLEGEREHVGAELVTVRELLVRATPPGASAPVFTGADAGGREPAPTDGSGAAAPTDVLGRADEPWPDTPDTRDAPATAGAAASGDDRTIGDPDADRYRGEATPGHHFAPPLTDAAVDASREQGGDRPMATTAGGPAGVGAGARAPSAPTSFAAAGMPEPEKTLRCQDCGAMNYPTEWYCERCGGELAAL